MSAEDPQTKGEVHRVGNFHAVHETPRDRPHEGATLHVWHKHGVSEIYISRDPDELQHLIDLLEECKVID